MDSKHWDKIFEQRKAMIPPEEYLVENLNYLEGETVLDLGCGDGRNSIYLREKGFQVTSVDFSEIGLHRIKKENPTIKTILLDINVPKELQNIGKYNSIILNHFIPDEASLKVLPDLLMDNGTLLIVAFAPEMIEQREYSKNLILDFTIMGKNLPYMNILKKEKGEDERGIFNKCILRKE